MKIKKQENENQKLEKNQKNKTFQRMFGLELKGVFLFFLSFFGFGLL